MVHVVLEQNFEIERPLAPKILRIYSPYWLTVARCPPLAFRLVDISSRKTKQNILPFKSKKINDVVVEEITEEEFHDGYTIASALNFKLLGMSASISDNGNDHFGDVKDLSALGDMVLIFSLQLQVCFFNVFSFKFFFPLFLGRFIGHICL